MNGRKNIFMIVGFVLSVSLIASTLSVMFVSHHYEKLQFHLLNAICGTVLEQEPEAKEIVFTTLKEYVCGNMDGVTGSDVLETLGYRRSDFLNRGHRQIMFFAIAGFLAGAFLFVCTFLYRNQMEARRIQDLAGYLEQADTGKAAILCAAGEDDFSKLEDEIYKTVTSLYQMREEAVEARNDFAENLSNIAHQIKTPITAVSLSMQSLQKKYGKENFEPIQRQLLRLTRLEEALLLLSCLDAGTLLLEKDEIDVFTVLVLAADNLQEIFMGSDTSIDIPELGEMAVTADLDWTMEALINLMKNCMEHNPGGTIHCSYGQNPLYTEISIWDDGKGFRKEDMPHLFERFYRGKNACGGGIGIGLALSKEIIERQNGTIQAKNMPDGGACFEVRFYRS